MWKLLGARVLTWWDMVMGCVWIVEGGQPRGWRLWVGAGCQRLVMSVPGLFQ